MPSDSPFRAYHQVSDLVERNPNVFRTTSAAYYFIEKHLDELQTSGALIRLGAGRRAPILVNEELILEKCLQWAKPTR